MPSYPVLYSFRRCPYAMRARIALAKSGITVTLREVELKNKPAELLALSSKATVPALHLASGVVISESLDIVYWALAQNDPAHWLNSLTPAERLQADKLINENDGEFKYYLDRYKYADRYPEHSQIFYRDKAEITLLKLEQLLKMNGCLLRSELCVADIAILPFIRQFAAIDPGWLEHAPYPLLRHWLQHFINSDLFAVIMKHYSPWQTGQSPIYFP